MFSTLFITPYVRRTNMPMIQIISDDSKEIKRIKVSNVTLVRTISAGVHFGIVKKHKGKEVTLVNARRLWFWSGACSLSQVAVDGVNLSESKISVTVPEIILTEAIELISMTDAASKQMMEAEPWKIQ
jgi:Domain of unknown function (DUF6948)